MKSRRRIALGFCCLLFACMIALATPVSAQAPAPLTVKPLSGGVYYTMGGDGGNTGIIVGKDGVIVFDAKTTADSAKEMLAQIPKLSPKPVTTVILSHSDADHVNGLAGFPKGLTIIAQETCKKEMEASLNGPQPAPRDYLPTQTVKMKEATTIDGVRIELLHWAPAHTGGDLIAYLPDQKIVFAGDILIEQMPFTLIHGEKNGTSAGWVETVKGMLALNADTFIPGHGNPMTRADVQKRLAAVEKRRADIKALVAQGKSLDDIKKALNDTEKPIVLPNGITFPTFTDVVYKEDSKK
jgi:glyoxylase-like metal-dependent hydrolase (beta-lactamase superfamily II)